MNRCARGDLCHLVDSEGLAVEVEVGPFCMADRGKIRRALVELPKLHALLRHHVRHRPTGAAGPPVGGSRPRKLVIDTEADALAGEIVIIIQSWACSLTDQLQLMSGSSLEDACSALVAHLDTFTRMDLHTVSRWVPAEHVPYLAEEVDGFVRSSGDAMIHYDASGADACLEILDVHYRARKALKIDYAVRSLHAPCPKCSRLGLVHVAGRESVVCSLCGFHVSMSDYDVWSAVLRTSGDGRTAPNGERSEPSAGKGLRPAGLNLRTFQGVCDLTGRSVRTVRSWIAAGTLVPIHRDGRRDLFRTSDALRAAGQDQVSEIG